MTGNSNSSPDWEKVVEIFEAALEMPVAQRQKFVASSCGNDEKLRTEVEQMLAADVDAEEFIELPAVAGSSLSLFQQKLNTAAQTGAFLNKKFGAFRTVREIGRGGMGTVYLAERADGEFEQRVAIKLVRRGMDTDFTIRRFKQERQILANLDHPSIACLIDGGTTLEEGLPYLVMEYVDGVSLLDYCEKNKLSIKSRLELFEQICGAVSYAHERNVLHRDLKPNNILVKDDGTVKLLDFGIAKLHDPNAASQTLEMSFATRWLMTPEYASPEQARGERLSPASDVYSLGVILYQLIAGHAPYKFPSRAPHEIARIICEAPPEPIEIKGETNFAISDLTKIILKTLAKSPNERFNTVEDMQKAISAFRQETNRNLSKLIPQNAGVPQNDSGKVSENGQKSLAILPFRLLLQGKSAGDESLQDTFLSIGLADALTIRLSKVRQILVRPTSSVLQFAEKTNDSLNLGKSLGVDYVLEGSVLSIEGRMRVAVQLFEISDNRVLWAAQFDENAEDIFALQDSIADKTLASLVTHLTKDEQQRLQNRGTLNPAAYEAYLRGRAHFYTYEGAGIKESIVYLQEAVRLDPKFAAAYAGIADYYNWMEVYSFMRPSQAYAAAKDAARRAIEIDTLNAEAHASLAFAAWGHDWNFAESERLYRKAIELNPNNPRAHEWFSFLLQTIGRNDDAIAEMEIARRLDPQSASHLAGHHYVHFMARRYEEADKIARRGLEIAPENLLCLHSLGWSSPFLGRIEEGIEAAQRAVERAGRFSLYLTTLGYDLAISERKEEARQILREMEAREKAGEYFPQVYFAIIYAGLGEIDEAFTRLDKNTHERDHWRTTLLIDPRLDSLRQDSRFAEQISKLKPANVKTENPGNVHSAKQVSVKKAFKPKINSADLPNGMKSLAILPFQWNQDALATENSEDTFLSVALADALTARLSNIKEINVRPTGTVLHFTNQNKNSQTMGELLEVDFLLEGRISKTENRVRVAAQLLRISDKQVLWAAQFDESNADIFALQDSIVEKTAQSLAPQLSENEQERLLHHGTRKPEAYEAYLRGRYFWHTYEPQDILKSIEYLQEAVRLDPNFADAYAGIADYYNWMVIWGILPPQKAFPMAKEFARHSIELDPGLAQAYTSLGFATFGYDCDFAESERLYRRALELNPNHFQAYQWYSYIFSAQDRHEEAIAKSEIAKLLDPRSPSVYSFSHFSYFMARRYDEALREIRLGLEIDPHNPVNMEGAAWSLGESGNLEEAIRMARLAIEKSIRQPLYLMTLANLLGRFGERNEAREILDELLAIKKQSYIPQYFLALVYTGLGELDNAFQALERGFEERDYWLLWMPVEPRFDTLRKDARFRELAKKLKPSAKNDKSLFSQFSATEDSNSSNSQPGAFKSTNEQKLLNDSGVASRTPDFRITSEGVSISWRTIAISAVTLCLLLIIVLVYMIAKNW